MGANQSSGADGGSNARGGSRVAGSQRICYYDLLDLDRHASDDE